MRKKDVILPSLAVLTGLIALFLRRWELNTAFEPDTGLAIPGMSSTWALIGFSVAIAVAMALLSRGRYSGFHGYDQAFSAKGNALYMTLMAAAALLMAAFCVAELLTLPAVYAEATAQQQLHRGGPSGAFTVFPRVLLSALAAVSGYCILRVGRNNYRSEGQGKFCLPLLLPAYTAWLWLVVAYQARSGDPVILDYVWELFAIIAAVLGTYLMSGFSFERGRMGATVFALSYGVYLILLTLGDGHGLTNLLLYGAFLLYLLASLHVLLGNGEHPAEERMPGEPPDPATNDLIQEVTNDE